MELDRVEGWLSEAAGAVSEGGSEGLGASPSSHPPRSPQGSHSVVAGWVRVMVTWGLRSFVAVMVPLGGTREEPPPPLPGCDQTPRDFPTMPEQRPPPPPPQRPPPPPPRP